MKTPAHNRRTAGLVSLVVGAVLLVAATWAVMVAPESARVLIKNRTGIRHYEVGLWALYIAPFLAFYMGWYGLRSSAEAGTRRPALLILLVAAITVAWQWSMISEVIQGMGAR